MPGELERLAIQQVPFSGWIIMIAAVLMISALLMIFLLSRKVWFLRRRYRFREGLNEMLRVSEQEERR